jgi:hypothetical protein
MLQSRTTLAARVGTLALLVLSAVGCSADRPALLGPVVTETQAQDGASPVEATESATLCERLTPLAQTISASATIGAGGGSLELKEAGVRLIVPAGAVQGPTTFAVTALAGGAVAYEFEPHGSRFPVPLTIEQTTKGLDWRKVTDYRQLEAAYFADASQIDEASGQAAVNEFLPLSWDYIKGKLQFKVTHFSGYMVSTGRTKGTR